MKTEIAPRFIRGVEQVGGFRGKSNILAENAVFGGRPDFYKHSLDVLNAATPQQVLATARKLAPGRAARPRGQSVRARARPPSGAGADRSKLPMPQTLPQAPFPPFEQATLANGMRLIVAERHAVPVVQFSLRLDAGYAADQLASPGVATSTMEMLDEGTATMDALEISDTLSRLGAELTSGSNLDFSVVGLSALKENLDESLAIYADVILNPAFAPAGARAREALAARRHPAREEHARVMALRVLPRLLYGDGHALLRCR